ncbi:hypothetical protein D3C81_1742750 [compost metagenome]
MSLIQLQFQLLLIGNRCFVDGEALGSQHGAVGIFGREGHAAGRSPPFLIARNQCVRSWVQVNGVIDALIGVGPPAALIDAGTGVIPNVSTDFTGVAPLPVVRLI